MKVRKEIEQIDTAEQYVLSVIREEHPEWIDRDGSCSRCEQYYKYLDDLISLDERWIRSMP